MGPAGLITSRLTRPNTGCVGRPSGGTLRLEQHCSGETMTQDQLNQIYDDICVHGRNVEGWSCDTAGDGHTLKDNKRQSVWARVADGEWIEEKKPA